MWNSVVECLIHIACKLVRVSILQVLACMDLYFNYFSIVFSEVSTFMSCKMLHSSILSLARHGPYFKKYSSPRRIFCH